MSASIRRMRSAESLEASKERDISSRTGLGVGGIGLATRGVVGFMKNNANMLDITETAQK